MSADILPSFQAAIVDAFKAAGHTVTWRVNRADNRVMSVDGGRETNFAIAFARMESIMTAERSWPQQRRATG